MSIYKLTKKIHLLFINIKQNIPQYFITMDMSSNSTPLPPTIVVAKKEKKKKKKKTRCWFEGCNKKLTISTITCVCKKRFCGIHRHQERHNCSFINVLDKKTIMQKHGLGGGLFSKVEVI